MWSVVVIWFSIKKEDISCICFEEPVDPLGTNLPSGCYHQNNHLGELTYKVGWLSDAWTSAVMADLWGFLTSPIGSVGDSTEESRETGDDRKGTNAGVRGTTFWLLNTLLVVIIKGMIKSKIKNFQITNVHTLRPHMPQSPPCQCTHTHPDLFHYHSPPVTTSHKAHIVTVNSRNTLRTTDLLIGLHTSIAATASASQPLHRPLISFYRWPAYWSSLRSVLGTMGRPAHTRYRRLTFLSITVK